jgi:hypothetical protein
MGRRSKIEALPGPIKQAVDELQKTGRYKLDDVLAHLRKLGAEHQVPAEALPGRSALGEYAQNFERTAARMREAKQLAEVWVGRLGQEPESKVGRLITEMLRTVAFQQLAAMGDDAAAVGSMDIMMIARAIKDLESAEKISADREIKIREQVAKEAAKVVDEAAKEGGLSADRAAELRRKVLGLGNAKP